jgi:predicted nuclease of restriction endonuclease-like RecB superfamily
VLTADLVNARRRGGELVVVALDPAARQRAIGLADTLLATARAHVGRTRDELLLALCGVEVGPREHRLRDGLVKLIEDRCAFETDLEQDPEAIRREVFAQASAVRAALPAGGVFDRRAVLATVAAARATTPEILDRSLFADLRGAHVVTALDPSSAESLVLVYEHAQSQAVLLRAVKVTIDVRCDSAGAIRALFRRLKFLQLLYTISRTDDGHRIVIDGPFSLFESGTKYGLKLALVLPALESCSSWRLEADVRWGKERTPLAFRLAGGCKTARDEPSRLPDDVDALMRSFTTLDGPWRVSPNRDILELPGVGLSVPDLLFERARAAGGTDRVYFEVLGYWSRAAVWKRVELVQAGLAESILFAIGARLRVSEAALDGDLPSALYVYKRTMSPRAIVERLDGLASRQTR